MADQRVFDRSLLRRHRDRAAPGLSAHDFLFREVAERLAERLGDIKRPFPLALDLGCHGGELRRAMAGRGGIETLVQCDISPVMAALARGADGVVPALAADEEFLPFAEASFDLIVSSLSLHWVNDLPGALIQIRRALKPDGLFLAALLGGETLHELGAAWMKAELAEGGAGVHVAPFADIRDAGALLQRAGFALPVADTETIVATYADVFGLMADLRGMGEANAGLLRRRAFTRRETLARMAQTYAETFAEEDGRIPATFQVIYLTAWAPHESQQKPLRPGSAAARLAEALNTVERPAGDKTRP
jgi:malonyl-ACP O-methyltransferase BioC